METLKGETYMSGKKMNRKITWSLLCIALAGVIFVFFVQARDRIQPDLPPTVSVRPVKYMVVKQNSGEDSRIFPGIVREAGETRLAFRVGGTLQKLDIAIGHPVKKGDILAIIDPRDYKINLTRLRASLEEAIASLSAMESGARKEDIVSLTAQVAAAKANLERSRKNWERLTRLVKENFVSKSQYDMATADLSACQAQYDAAVQELEKGKTGARSEDIAAANARIKQLKASIQAAAFALEDTVLRAPFNGIINRKLVENFEAITPGQPIVSLLDFSTVDVRTNIPEEMILKRKLFTELVVELDAYPGRVIPAVIKELGLKTDHASQSFPLTVSLTLPGGIDIQPGMTASVKIGYSDNSSGSNRNIMVPATAVFSNEKGEPCVWKINTKTMMLSAAKLSIKEINDDFITIISGLIDGDHIVTAGARFLNPNQKIKLMKSSGNTAS